MERHKDILSKIIEVVANLGTTLRQQVEDGQEESLIANEQLQV